MRIKLMPLVVALSLLCALFAVLEPSPTAGQKRSQSRGKSQKRKNPKPSPPAESEYKVIKISSKIELELGMKLPGTQPKTCYSPYITTTGPFIPGPNKSDLWEMKGKTFCRYEAEWAGIKGDIGADDNWAINYITTSDPAFVTSEGLKVSDSAEKVLKVSKGEVVKESDYEFSVRLPSGWFANFWQIEYDAKGKLVVVTNGQLRPDTKVASFFKK